MIMPKFIWIIFLLCAYTTYAQVKVGDHINTIDGSSLLELESSDKVFVPTRMDTAQMNGIVPLEGALVYNTDANCLFIFEGAGWKSLCTSQTSVTTADTPPTNPGTGDVWFNTRDSSVNLWDGTVWVAFPSQISNGSGPPNAATVPDPVGGTLYVDRTTGTVYAYDGTTWIVQTSNASNGLTKGVGALELGGTLTRATAIDTDSTNTLAIRGLEEQSDPGQAVITVDEASGILRKSSLTDWVQHEEVVIRASDSQNRFTPPLTISSSKKLNVYRNGVKLGFTVINDTTIELENPVVCYRNDEIRIVQYY